MPKKVAARSLPQRKVNMDHTELGPGGILHAKGHVRTKLPENKQKPSVLCGAAVGSRQSDKMPRALPVRSLQCSK